MMDYYTPEKEYRAELTEKHSRFIARCAPLSTEKQAVEYIEQVRAQHRDASHTVYAYLLRGGNMTRYSDDGEPAGTAGLPVLETLRGAQLSDAVVTVTRYFGGTLLGKGGLVRAYGDAARLAIAGASRAHMVQCRLLSVKCDYSAYEPLKKQILQLGGRLTASDFAAQVVLKLALPLSVCADFVRAAADISCGRAELCELSREYVAFLPPSD